MKNWFIYSLAAGITASTLLSSAANATDALNPVKLTRSGYTKITLSWPNSGGSYSVYRNNTLVATVNGGSYTDSALEPGTAYNYTVTAPDGTTGSITISTLSCPAVDNPAAFMAAVDEQHIMQIAPANAAILLNNLKNSLGRTQPAPIEYTAIDADIVQAFVQNELTKLLPYNEITAVEQAEFKTKLEALLAGNLHNAQFDNIYTRHSLINLAEKHLSARKTAGAIALYELLLEYSGNDEAATFNALSRLADIKRMALTSSSTAAELSDTITGIAGCYLRFIDRFPDSTSKFAEGAYRNAAYNYFMNFPDLLNYGNYNSAAYNSAISLLQTALSRFPSSVGLQRLHTRIMAWQLDLINIQFGDNTLPDGSTLRIVNASAANGKSGLYPKLPYTDERQLAVNASQTVPCYNGHDYILALSIPVEGGGAMSSEIPLSGRQPGWTLVWTPSGTTFEPSAAGETGIKIDFGTVDYPYNLTAERNIDVFTLRWNFVPANEFTVDHFTIYRNGAEVGQTASNVLENLPLVQSGGGYDYTVAAYDAAGNASPSSPVLRVEPGDLSAHADFFAWLKQYFGDTPMLSIDDPDNDGIDNYHEFLANSNPALATGPELRRGPRGYTALSMVWESAPAETNVQYEIRENGSSAAPVVVSGGSYTARNLSSDADYSFSIRLLKTDGTATDWSVPLTMHTLKNNQFVNENNLATAIDAALPGNNLTGTELLSYYKSTLPDGTTAFSTIDSARLEELLGQELEALTANGVLTAGAQAALLTELKTILSSDGTEKDFEVLYIYTQLLNLAEKYFYTYRNNPVQSANYDAAVSLYRLAMNFNNEPAAVANILNRLAVMRMQTLNANSGEAEILAALSDQSALRMEFITRFGDEFKSNMLLTPHKTALAEYLKYFPVLLTYNSYSTSAFDAASSLAESWQQFAPSVTAAKYRAMVSAWPLTQLAVNVTLPNGGSGKFTIRNISEKLSQSPYIYSSDAVDDTRSFTLNGQSLSVPAYAGHLYELSVTTPVQNGPEWTRTLSGIRFQTGKTITWANNQWQSATGENSLTIIATQPETPYNLTADIYGDVFDLRWDFTAPGNFVLDHFNIYRGENLLDSVPSQVKYSIPRGLTADQVYSYYVTAVSADGIETALSEAFQVLPEFTKDDLTYFEWKQKWFGDTPVLSSDDSDGDGLTNYQEFILGSNPLLAPPASDTELAINKISGIKAAYYQGVWMSMPKFSDLVPYKQGVLNRFQFDSTLSNVLDSDLADNAAAELSGYFDVPADGMYKFFLSSDDGCRFMVDGITRIDHNELNTEREIFKELYLKKGAHSYKIEYFEYNNYAHLQLYWSGASFERTRFDQSGLWYIDGEESAGFKEYLAGQRDSDGDGLSDFVEIKLGTDLLNADSDGDGLSDYAEVNELHTNPLNADSNNNGINDGDELELSGGNAAIDLSLLTFTPVLNIPGGEFVASTGIWRAVEEKALAADRRGTVDYQFTLNENGIYRLNVVLANFFAIAGKNNIDIYIDNVLIAAPQIELADTSAAHSEFTPYLTAGTHTLRLDWDNWSSKQKLSIENISFDKLTSLAEAADAQQELTDSVLENRNIITEKQSSRTSPAFIEGTALYPQLVKVNQDLATQLSGNKWYAELPLSAAEPVTAQVEFENGGLNKTAQIEWQITNIQAEDGQTIRIRKGDSLLLSAAPDEPGNSGSCVITALGESYTGKPKDAPATVQFNDAGTFEITGSYTPAGNGKGHKASSGTLTVEVIDYKFGRNDVVCWTGYAREWSMPTPAEGVQLVFDNRLKDASRSTLTTETLARVYADDNKPRFVSARLEDGTLLDMQRLSGVDCHANAATYVRILETYEDGSELVETLIVLNQVRSDVTVELDIFVPGVLFDTGEISKVITAEDFDELGMKTVRFVRSAGAATSVCHTMRLYQNGEYVGTRLK